MCVCVCVFLQLVCCNVSQVQSHLNVHCRITNIMVFFILVHPSVINILLDFKSSCVIKNRRKASKVKVLKFIDQNSALGCFPDQRLTKKQHQGNISQHIYRYCVNLCHFLVGRQNRPTLLQHSSPFVPFGSLVQNVLTVCTSLFSMCL